MECAVFNSFTKLIVHVSVPLWSCISETLFAASFASASSISVSGNVSMCSNA
jgi:hypothetical protein